MSDSILLRIEGLAATPRDFTLDDLRGLDPASQIDDVGQLDPKRQGRAVRLAALLDAVGAAPEARHVGLHATADDFHASIPLAAVRERGVVIYELDGAPLPVGKGGPIRFFIPDYAACRVAEIDECANVKFLDRIELTADRGFDNRPLDEADHAALHERQGGA